MKSGIKWWINGIAAAIFVVICAIYLLIRPIVVQNLEPVLEKQAGARVNGTLSWTAMDLDPNLDLSFTNLVLQDKDGNRVLETPSLTVGWTFPALYNYIVHNAGVADVVKSVTVETPVVTLAQKKDGTWNVSDIIRPSSDSEGGIFTGSVIIKDGSAKVTTDASGAFDLSGLNGTFSWDRDSHIKGNLDGTFLNSAVEGELKYVDSNNLEVHVKTDSLALKSLQPLLEQFPQMQHKFVLKDGTGEVTDAKIWKSDGTVAYRVSGSFNHAALSYENYILADGVAFFCIENGMISFTEASGEINGQKIGGEVFADINETSPRFHGKAHLKDFDVSAVIPDAGIKAALNGEISFAGTADNPALSGNLTVRGGSYENVNVDKGAVSFSYEEGALSIPYVEADGAGGHILGHGYYHENDGSFSFQTDLENIDISCLPLDGAAGVISGFCTAEGYYRDGGFTLQKASGNGSFSGFSYNGVSVGSFDGFGSYRGGNWKATGNGKHISYEGAVLDHVAFSLEDNQGTLYIPYASGLAGDDGAFYVSGSYSERGMDLAVNASKIDISAFSGLTGTDMGGILSMDCKLQGTMEHPEGSGTIHGRGGHVKNASFDRVDGSFTLYDDTLGIHDFHWAGNGGNHDVEGTIGVSSPHPMNLTVKTDNTRIENLLSMANLDYPVTGWISNELRLTGDMDNPAVSGDFSAWSGSIMGELFQSLSGTYTYENHEITLSNGLGYIYDGTVIMNGKAGDKGLDFNVSAADISIDRMLPGRGMEGRVSLNGKVKGTFEDPSFDGSAWAREITIGGSTIWNVSTGIHYKNNVVSVDEGSFHQKQGDFRWKGSYNLSSDSVNGYLDFNGWDIRDVMKLFKQSGDGVDGIVEGSMQISGTVDNPNVNFKAHVLGGHLGNTVLGEGNVDFSYMNKALSIRRFSIPVGSGLLAAQGSMTGDGALDIRVAARDVDTSWIPQVLGRKDISLGGSITAALDISGTKSRPVADISIGVEDPQYDGISFDNMSLMANISDNVITIQNALISKGNYRASMKGTLPGNVITGNKEDKAVPMNLDINLDQADMNMLALFFKPVTSAAGPIQGHMKITGNYDDPMILGGINIKDGSLTLTTLNEPVHPVNMNVTFSGNTASFDGSASLGGGSITAKGNLSWDHYQVGQYDGELHIHTPSINSSYYKGGLDGDFTLGEVKGFERPGIEGTLKVQDAVLDIPYSLLGDTGGSSSRILTKINVQVGDNVKLYNSALYNLMIRGNVSMMGPLSEPVMSGRVNVEKGTVRINTTEFKVDQANGTWGREIGSFLPDIHAKAFTKVGRYTVTAELEGPPGNMRTTFHSDPALNDSQIVMLLTLHQNPNSKENDGAVEGALFNAGLTMLFGNSIQDFLQDKIGLDLISVTSNLTDYYDNTSDNNEGYYYIKIGKYLFNDFMLTATMGMNNEEKSIGAHYDLNSRVGLSSWYNSNHDSYVGIDWTFKF